MSINDITNRITSPAPKWYVRIKNALTILADTTCVILLALGYSENSLIMLILRVGLSGLLGAIGALLTDNKQDE